MSNNETPVNQNAIPARMRKVTLTVTIDPTVYNAMRYAAASIRRNLSFTVQLAAERYLNELEAAGIVEFPADVWKNRGGLV